MYTVTSLNNQTPRLVSALVHARGARRCNGHVPHLRHSHRTDASQLLARGFALSLDKQRRFQLHAGEHLEAFPAIGHEGRDLLTHKGVSTEAHNTVTDVRRHRTSATTAPPEAAETVAPSASSHATDISENIWRAVAGESPPVLFLTGENSSARTTSKAWAHSAVSHGPWVRGEGLATHS